MKLMIRECEGLISSKANDQSGETNLKLFCLFCCFTSQATAMVNGRTVSSPNWERSGSVVECLTRDRRVAGSSLTGVTALWSLSKTHLS